MRSHRLAKRRERLGLGQIEIGAYIGHSAYVVSKAEALDRGIRVPYDSVWLHIPAIRQIMVYLESRKRCAREARRREDRRIEFQRGLWAALPDHPAVRALRAAMLERCLDLMHNGLGAECDAVAEFLPEPAVEAMLAQWERACSPAPAEPAATEDQRPSAGPI